MTHDVVVVGAGLAGLVAALRLAEAGRRVVVVATGVGSTNLSPVTVDVLGYDGGRVTSPAAALPAFRAAHPGHPYARIGIETISRSLEWFKGQMRAYPYVGGLAENLLLPSAVGAARPTALAPETMAAGDLRRGGAFAFVGFRQLKDFYPAYLADNVARTGLGVSARGIVIDPPTEGEADVGPLAFARRFEDAEFRKRVIAALDGRVEPGQAVGFPAVLGLAEAPTVWREIQDALGVPVFEVPTLPPSVPGMRVFRILKDALRRAGGKLVLGSRVEAAEASAGRAEAVVVRAAARPVAYRGRWFVLATGGFSSGGLDMDSRGTVRETVFGLPVAGAQGTEEPRFLPEYLAAHPMARAGVATDERLRPVGDDGRPVLGNVVVAGATLAGAEPWREKSGDGISLASGFRAAEVILEEWA